MTDKNECVNDDHGLQEMLEDFMVRVNMRYGPVDNMTIKLPKRVLDQYNSESLAKSRPVTDEDEGPTLLNGVVDTFTSTGKITLEELE